MPGRVIYVLRSWPRLSQTFIVNEVLALERRGVNLSIFAMTRSGETLVQPQVADVRADVTYLDEPPGRFAGALDHLRVARSAPLRYVATVLFAARSPGLSAGYATATTWQCLRHAVRVAATVLRMRRDGVQVDHLHAHFAHDPALVGLLTARLTGLPHTVTGHARDLYQIPVRNLAARAAPAVSLITCCYENAEHLRRVLPSACAEKVRVVHHGVDVARFVPAPRARDHQPPRLVSVGRLVQKKGFHDLLHACAQVARTGQPFRLTVYGDGPLRGELEDLASRLGLDGVARFAGEADGDTVLAALQEADVFALTPFVTDDGDRDGVPNVVVEAMACALPVVATAVGGVPEAVEHGRSGLLAEPHDVVAIADAIGALLADPDLRRRMGAAGRRVVEEAFDVDLAAAQLAALFRQPAS